MDQSVPTDVQDELCQHALRADHVANWQVRSLNPVPPASRAWHLFGEPIGEDKPAAEKMNVPPATDGELAATKPMISTAIASAGRL
jgi:hypothetical protein